MDRKEFLAAIGMSAATLTMISCMGCSKGSGTGPSNSNNNNAPANVDFTLDLTAAANAALLTNGGYLASNSVLVAKTNAGTYIAVQQSCTHESYPLVYQAANHEFYCNNHGSAFSEAGVVQNSPASRNLTVYKTTLTNNLLHITS